MIMKVIHGYNSASLTDGRLILSRFGPEPLKKYVDQIGYTVNNEGIAVLPVGGGGSREFDKLEEYFKKTGILGERVDLEKQESYNMGNEIRKIFDSPTKIKSSSRILMPFESSAKETGKGICGGVEWAVRTASLINYIEESKKKYEGDFGKFLQNEKGYIDEFLNRMQDADSRKFTEWMEQRFSKEGNKSIVGIYTASLLDTLGIVNFPVIRPSDVEYMPIREFMGEKMKKTTKSLSDTDEFRFILRDNGLPPVVTNEKRKDDDRKEKMKSKILDNLEKVNKLKKTANQIRNLNLKNCGSNV